MRSRASHHTTKYASYRGAYAGEERAWPRLLWARPSCWFDRWPPKHFLLKRAFLNNNGLFVNQEVEARVLADSTKGLSRPRVAMAAFPITVTRTEQKTLAAALSGILQPNHLEAIAIEGRLAAGLERKHEEDRGGRVRQGGGRGLILALG